MDTELLEEEKEKPLMALQIGLCGQSRLWSGAEGTTEEEGRKGERIEGGGGGETKEEREEWVDRQMCERIKQWEGRWTKNRVEG